MSFNPSIPRHIILSVLSSARVPDIVDGTPSFPLKIETIPDSATTSV
jgi:hypothetical protein